MFARKLPLIVAALILLCAASAGAVTITFTGNAKADFSTVPAPYLADITAADNAANLINGVEDFPDIIADPLTGKAGCGDAPLDANAVAGIPVTEIWASGLNVERDYAAYDSATDTMYLALVICHSHRLGDNKVSVAWDSDGDGDPETLSSPPPPSTFISPAFQDSTGNFDDSRDYQITLKGVNGGSNLLIYLSGLSGKYNNLSSDFSATDLAGSIWQPSTTAYPVVSEPATGSDPGFAVGAGKKLYDIEMKIAHWSTYIPKSQWPVELTTQSNSGNDGAGEDFTSALIQFPSIAITKLVSCSPTGPFTPSVTALRGSNVYFQICVTNTGTSTLNNVTVTDVYSTDGATASNPIPGTISLGTIPSALDSTGSPLPAATVCQVFTVPTLSTFALMGTNPDITNTASVTGQSTITDTAGNSTTVDVSAGPATATVNVLVPSLTCNKQVAIVDSAGHVGAFGSSVNFATSGPCTPTQSVVYQLTLNNTGEVPIDFTQGVCAGGNFSDTLLGSTVTGVSGTPANLATLFFTKLGGSVFAAGQSVSVTVPVTFTAASLCPATSPYPNGLVTNTFSACGLATEAGICLPPAGGETDSTGGCSATVQLCCPQTMTITKGVSCDSAGALGFGSTVNVIRGSTIYFQIAIDNTGSTAISNITITDVLTDSAGAFKQCGGCFETTTGTAVPVTCFVNGTLTVPGSLAVGQTRTFVCSAILNPAYTTISSAGTVITNSAYAVFGTNSTRTAKPDPTTTINVLVPSLTVDKEVSSDLITPTVWTKSLNLSSSAAATQPVHYMITLTNNGQVDIDFTQGACTTHFADTLLGVANAGITGTPVDVASLISAQLTNGVLKAGTSVSVSIPVTFVVASLCPQTTWQNTFTACGLATPGLLRTLTPTCGSETENASSSASVQIPCKPNLPDQAVPVRAPEGSVTILGYAGNGPQTITSVPGVLAINPGVDSAGHVNWSNFVKAATVGVPYFIKNVTLQKKTAQFGQCSDVFPVITLNQQGTPNIRLWWPLLYEVPGTEWTLTIAYGTYTEYDDGSGSGPAYFHTNTWTWSVSVSLQSMQDVLETFHELPFGLDEVPLISDENLYTTLQSDLSGMISDVASGDTFDAGMLLENFEMVVSDACIASSPLYPDPTGSITGIAETDENPACCKLLVDSEAVAQILGLYQQAK